MQGSNKTKVRENVEAHVLPYIAPAIATAETEYWGGWTIGVTQNCIMSLKYRKHKAAASAIDASTENSGMSPWSAEWREQDKWHDGWELKKIWKYMW